MSVVSPANADRNLLFGVLALQLDFVDRDALIVGMNAWVVDKAKPLGQILCDQGMLPSDRRRLLDALVDEHVRQHGGDVEASLVAATGRSTITQEFRGLIDPEVEATLSGPALVPSGKSVRRSHGGSRYCNLHPYARGGLGQIFVADDAELDRKVAVKEIQSHRADDPDSRSRFLREARITGALEHPGVIPVYGLGVHSDGRPYYAMRFVRGESLKAAIDRYHASGPRTNQPREMRELLRRFIDVCNAVAYAHSRGVIHRDLKPQNVMLGPFGETLVVDWGLAKEGVLPSNTDQDPTTDPLIRPASVSGQSRTEAGSALGTPGYMSPEQTAGRHDLVGFASDVFSLGATLYCLLTGRKPFEGTGADDEVAQTPNEQFAPPRVLNPCKPGALDAVCRKALAHDPASRYPSSLDLAADVERWLADEPVAVFRDPWTVRAARWARRRRTVVVVGIAILLTALVGLTVGSALVWREKERTVEEKMRAESERERAENNFATARTLILDSGQRISALETGQADQRKSDLDREAALDALIVTFDKFAVVQPNDRTLQRQAAALHRYAGNVKRLINDTAGAEKRYAASIRIWENLVESDAEAFHDRDNLAQALSDFGTFQKRAGKLEEATTTLERAAKLAEETKDHIPDSYYRRTLGTIFLNRADVDYRKGESKAAEQASRKAAELLESLKDAPKDEKMPVDPILVVMAHLGRAETLRDLGRDPDAMKEHDDAVARVDAMDAKESRNVRHFANKTRLERAITRGKLAEKRAATAAELAGIIESAERLIADYPNAPIYKEVLVGTWLLRGELETALNQPKPANDDLNKALAMTRQLLDKSGNQPDHIGLRARAYLLLGRLGVAEKKPADAEKNLDAAVKVYEFAVKFDPDNVFYRRGLDQATKELKDAKAKP